eukprot:jgi/Antlo1/804/212
MKSSTFKNHDTKHWWVANDRSFASRISFLHFVVYKQSLMGAHENGVDGMWCEIQVAHKSMQRKRLNVHDVMKRYFFCVF